jgi:hypothetical protein
MSDKFVFLLEPGELETHFGEWTEKVYLAIKYDSDVNESSFLFFREEEMDKALLDFVDDLPIIPEVEGYPTTKISFATENKILSMVLDELNLPKYASEYSEKFESGEVEEDFEEETIDNEIDFTVEQEHKEERSYVEPKENTSDKFEELPTNINDDFVTSDEVDSRTALICKTKNSVMISGANNFPSLDIDNLRFNIKGNEIFIPFAEDASNFKMVNIPISYVPNRYWNKIPNKKSTVSFNEYKEDGIVLYLNSLEPNQKTTGLDKKLLYSLLTVFVLMLSVVGISTNMVLNASKKANLALSLAEEVNAKSSLQSDMNPIYLNNLRNKLSAESEQENE